MLKKIRKLYYKFFDKIIGNWITIIAIIAFLIISVGSITNSTTKVYAKELTSASEEILIIDWKVYKQIN